MNNDIKILLADDEPDALEFMQYNLRKEGYTVFKALNGKEAIAIAQREQPQLIVLDVMMPELDGMQTCRELRTLPNFNQTLIIVLTARNEEFTQLMGLDLGADDYLTKPIRPHLFVSKIKSLLRRYQDNLTPLPSSPSNQIVKAGDIEIDKERFTVWRNGETIELPRKEFNLLLLLASKSGKVFTRDEILRKIWGSDIIVGDRTIDVHIRKIREKLGDGYIKTLKGIGYKFDA